LTLWLKIPAEMGLARIHSRGQSDRIEQSGLSFHCRVQEGYEALHRTYPDRIVAIDATLPASQVTDQCIAEILARLPIAHTENPTHD
jgi:dTMP kinase